MIIDSLLEFSDKQELTSVGTAAQTSTNIIDFGSGYAGKDVHGGTEYQRLLDINWFVNIQVAMVGASRLLFAELVTGSSTSSSAISSSVTLARIEFPAVSPAGTKRAMKLMTGDIKRYLAVEYISDGSKISSVTVDSGLILGYADSEVGQKFHV